MTSSIAGVRWPVLCAVGLGAAGAAYWYYSGRRRPLAHPQSEFEPFSPSGSPYKGSGDDGGESPFIEDDEDDVQAAFEDAAAFVHACGQNFSSQIKLAFYAFYKQATEGPCTANPPPLYDMVGRAKWNHWRELGSLPKKEAMLQYLFLAQQIIQSLQQPGEGGAQSGGDYGQDAGKGEGSGTFGGPAQSTLGEMAAPEGERVAGVSELGAAARDGDIARMQQLVASGADSSVVDESGMTPLMWAVDRGQTEAAAALLDAGVNADATDPDGLTALHYAVTCGHEAIARLLVEKGARTDLPDLSGDTATDGRPESWASWWPAAPAE